MKKNTALLSCIFIIFVFILFYLYINSSFTILNNNNNLFQDNLYPLPASSYSLNTNDILLNPYSAPLRDDRYIINNTNRNTYMDTNINMNKIPINIKTQSINTTYRQIGILTRDKEGDLILPLMGKPLITNRDKWNFYTMNDKNPMIKLPIFFKNKNGLSEQGCDNIYNGDKVYVEGYNDNFKATIYDNNTMEYIPYL